MEIDRSCLSLIGHEGFLSWNPVGLDVLEAWCAGLGLGEESHLLDVGCGRAELMIRLLEQRGGQGLGVDPNPAALAIARAEAERRLPAGRVAWAEGKFDHEQVEQASMDLAICLGSTQAFDGFESALWILRERIKPGGHLLLGEGFWRREPAQEYLDFLQCQVGDLHSHLVNVRLAEEAGLEVLQAHEATEDEWTAYEDVYHAQIVAWCEANPDDPDAPGFRAHIEAWRAAYLSWGRTTLGFGVYLLKRPE